MLSVFKKLLFWNYARSSWQWDALCVLILIFIFLTPKSWFATGERQIRVRHQTPILSTVLLSPEVIDNEKDMVRLQDRVRAVTGRPNAEIVEVRKRVGQDGTILGYEVDIR